MKNIKIMVIYDGTRYKGWQKQTNTENTLQEKLNNIFSAICNENIELIGAGRTDAGVHAKGQIANFKTSSGHSAELLKKLANESLERDICIKDAVEVDSRFHARYNAVGKKYLYRIWNNEDVNVFERKYTYHLTKPLDLEKMDKAAEGLIGTYDFKAFTSDRRTKKSTVKTITSIEITNHDGMVEILFHGDSFLYHMVRIITGTLIEVGLGIKSVDEINQILESRDRGKAGFTVPPQGLFLIEVIY